jgi:DNA-binding NarL/FixJ family response regulator
MSGTVQNARETGKPAKVFLVDDHPIVREGLAAQLANRTDLVLCGSAEDVAEAAVRIPGLKPDVIVVDISLKTGNGLDLVKRLKAKDEHMRVLVWSMYPENLYAERALRAGAMGYVHKGRAASTIMEALRSILDGHVYLSEEMSAKLLFRVLGTDGSKELYGSEVERLTDRELEAFELLGQGLTTKQIAEKMHVSPKTVETYRARIKEKLNLENATELIQRAVQWVVEQE